jgi:hypothetical protein
MRADILIQTQRLMAQTVMGLAKSIENAMGVQLKPITWAQLPANPKAGMLVYLGDSNSNTYGQAITGSGSYVVLALFDGTDWVVH